MSIAPPEIPRIAGAARLSEPSFDIMQAVSGARQASLPTVQLLRAAAIRRAHRLGLNVRCHLLGGSARLTGKKAPRVARFLDLADDPTILPETMNSLFTREVQPMSNSSGLKQKASEQFPPDVQTMERK